MAENIEYEEQSEVTRTSNRSVIEPKNRIPNKETMRIMEFEAEVDAIGSGRHGVVFRCIHRLDKGRYALKVVPFNAGLLAPSFEKEIRTLHTVQHHPNIIFCYTSFQPNNPPALLKAILEEKLQLGQLNQVYCIVMALYPRTLEERIDNGIDDIKTIWRLFGEILMGVDHFHKKGYIHRDLTRYSIFLDDSDSAKVANFGLAVQKAYDHGPSELQESSGLTNGDIQYHAPERFNSKVCQQSDIYQIGLILFEMLHPMSKLERTVAFENLKNGVLPKTFSYPTSIKCLVLSMLSKHPTDRPSIHDLIAGARGKTTYHTFGLVSGFVPWPLGYS